MGRKEGIMERSVISVIMPAYNEEKTIGAVISESISVMDSLRLPYEVIVVDDGSGDHTMCEAMRYKTIVLSNGENKGKGYSIRKGFQYAQGNIIVTIDSDGEHKPKEIPDLLNPIFNGTDIVAGSRFLGNQGQVTAKLNQIGNFLFNVTIMALTRKRITDSQTGFRAMKRSVFEKLSLESDGYEIDTEITVKGLRNGFRFREMPITCERRKYSISKLKLLSDGTKILKTILKANFSKIEHDVLS